MSCHTRSRGLGLYVIKVVWLMKCDHQKLRGDCPCCNYKVQQATFDGLKERAEYLKNIARVIVEHNSAIPIHVLNELEYIAATMQKLVNKIDIIVDLWNAFNEMEMSRYVEL